MPTRTRHLLLAALALGALLSLTFSLLVLQSRRELQAELRQKIIERPADLLAPIAHLELTDAAPRLTDSPLSLLAPVLRSARQQGMLAVSLYESDGHHLRSIPELPRPALTPADLTALALAAPRPVSRYYPAFRLQDFLSGFPADTEPTPVLEVLVPLQIENENLGLVRYLLDARPLARELAAIDARIRRQTVVTISLGAFAICALLALATWLLHRASRTLAERNARLLRSQQELTLSVKASALGQITSHLLHGLQGPVAGLRSLTTQPVSADWQTAADYTARLQTLLTETLTILGDQQHSTTYELTLEEIATLIRQHNQPAASAKNIHLLLEVDGTLSLDNHRAHLLCLIAHNLLQNAIAVSAPASTVTARLHAHSTRLTLSIIDQGPGIPHNLRATLFTPGHSAREGGTGLGLALSQLLAHQINATLALTGTGPQGTTFELHLPLLSATRADRQDCAR